MVTIETTTAREFCRAMHPRNWDVLQRFIGPEIKATKAARLMGGSMIEFAPKSRRHVTSLLAAELYPDRETPELIVGRDESETHEAIRARGPATEARVSAEQFKLKNLDHIEFLSLDPVILEIGVTTLPTETQLPKVAEWLYDQNIVPVDSEYRIMKEQLSSPNPPTRP